MGTIEVLTWATRSQTGHCLREKGALNTACAGSSIDAGVAVVGAPQTDFSECICVVWAATYTLPLEVVANTVLNRETRRCEQ